MIRDRVRKKAVDVEGRRYVFVGRRNAVIVIVHGETIRSNRSSRSIAALRSSPLLHPPPRPRGRKEVGDFEHGTLKI